MDVRLIAVPYHAGDSSHGASQGPQRLLDAGAAGVLADRGVVVTIEHVGRGEAFRDTAASAAVVNQRLAAVVRETVAVGHLPVVVAGSCNAAMGVLAGFDHAGCGAVWLDAHADFNTPETTVSGFFPGMSLAIVLGHCYGDYWKTIGDSTPLAEAHTVLLGVRDVSPDAERQHLAQSDIRVVRWRGGNPQHDVVASLDELSSSVDEVYVHIDFDCFAPEVAPGVADEPVPGGLSLTQAEDVVHATADRFAYGL